MIVRLVLAFLFLTTLGIASNVLFPLEKVEVVGNKQLSAAQVRQITGIELNTPWLWTWVHKLRPLEANPWVVSAQLERPALAQARIVLRERTSVANIMVGEQRMGLSIDGKILPDAPLQKPLLSGTGERPLSDLVALMKLFPQAERIRYDSSGFRVVTPTFTVWGRSVKELQDWSKRPRIASRETQAASAAGTVTPPASPASIYVYSWGVSVRQ